MADNFNITGFGSEIDPSTVNRARSVSSNNLIKDITEAPKPGDISDIDLRDSRSRRVQRAVLIFIAVFVLVQVVRHKLYSPSIEIQNNQKQQFGPQKIQPLWFK